MRELSLFTGAGGGVYGLKLCGARCVAYVEFNKFCRAVIAQRIDDGIFDDAPIFNDVRTFDGTVWRDRVDIISAGFPCQPFSTAGERRGADDPKNLWPETARIIGDVMPPLVWLENSPSLAFSGYLGVVLSDLSALGYDAQWSTLSAAQCGAPHKRDRIWLLAALPDDNLHRLDKDRRRAVKPAPRPEDSSGRGLLSNAWGRHDAKTTRDRAEKRGNWWGGDPADQKTPLSQPIMDRVVHGVANRSHRIKALGNGQVPSVVAHAFEKLLSRFNEDM